MYQLHKNSLTNELNGITRLSDGAFIPLDEGNLDYLAYLEWVKAGNAPLPLEEN